MREPVDGIAAILSDLVGVKPRKDGRLRGKEQNDSLLITLWGK
jgi:hypothetical protein